jgi:hypothetical protein
MHAASYPPPLPTPHVRRGVRSEQSADRLPARSPESTSRKLNDLVFPSRLLFVVGTGKQTRFFHNGRNAGFDAMMTVAGALVTNVESATADIRRRRGRTILCRERPVCTFPYGARKMTMRGRKNVSSVGTRTA